MSKKQKTFISFGYTKTIRHNEAGQCSYVVLNFDRNHSLDVLINKVLIKQKSVYLYCSFVYTLSKNHLFVYNDISDVNSRVLARLLKCNVQHGISTPDFNRASARLLK